MTKWKNININTQNIVCSTDHATLFKCPKNSTYAGYCFWHTNRLVRDGRHSSAVSIGYTDEFTFRMIKYGKGKHNKQEKLEEVEINVAEFEEIFGIMNENIHSAKTVYDKYETHKPEILDPEKTEADEELIDG